jgi:methionyl-tRNA formyltransferase
LQISVASSSPIARELIECLLASDHELVSLITNPDKATGRGKKIVPNELAEWASLKGLNVAKPADTSELNRHLLSAQPQLIVTIAYGRIIPVELLHGPRFGWVNVHFSLLPKYRGAAPVQWALINGEKKTGFTIFKLDKGMDTGPIYVSKEVPIKDGDTTDSLLKELTHLAAIDLLELVKGIGKTRATPQPLTGATYAPKISKEDAKIDWQNPTESILLKERALSSNPGIWTTFRGERLGLHGFSEYLGENTLINPGDIEAVNGRFLVRTKDSIIEILELTPAGKKRMSGADFIRGARLTVGEKFE